MCFPPYLGFFRGGRAPKGARPNLLMQFSSLGSSTMVVPVPFSRCLTEGTTILMSIENA